MIIFFKFKNAGSFADETVLDLRATRSTEYEDSISTICGERILPISGIFGANASGKSNVYGAFATMMTYISNSANTIIAKQMFDEARFWTYRFDEVICNEDMEYEIAFTLDDNIDEKEMIYKYGFSISENGISEEWLQYKTQYSEFKDIFIRTNYNQLDIKSAIDLKIKENILASLNNKSLVLSLAANLNEKLSKRIHNYFINSIILDFSRENIEKILYSNYTDYINFEENKNNLIKFLSIFDDSIKDIKIKNYDPRTKIKEIETTHIVKSKSYPLNLLNESTGTKKMIILYSLFARVLTHGGYIFIDELSDSLHSLLMRYIMQLFTNNNTNPGKAQLLFTSHDHWLMNASILRRDEIWLTEKNSEGKSELYSISDFKDYDGEKIRKDENLDKNYMVGKYGGIPIIKSSSNNSNLEKIYA